MKRMIRVLHGPMEYGILGERVQYRSYLLSYPSSSLLFLIVSDLKRSQVTHRAQNGDQIIKDQKPLKRYRFHVFGDVATGWFGDAENRSITYSHTV